MNNKTGTLYGIGVGPGDPELLTMKAVRILRQVDIVFAAASTKNDHSLAMNIAAPHIPEHAVVKKLRFPMTRDRKIVRKAWREHARTIIGELEKGQNVAFLTLGDSMTYSTYGYVLRHIQAAAPHIAVETVPGITSYQAAAARLNTPLVEGEEALMIVSGAKGGDRLRELQGKPENIVFLKAYRHVEDIRTAIDESSTYVTSVGIKNCGLPDEEIVPDLGGFRERAPNYWTLIIAKKNKKDAATEE